MKDNVIRFAYTTDVGKVRDHQEDSLLWYDPGVDEQALERKGHLYVVADGMGGHAAGEVASKIAVETIVDLYKTDSGSDVPAILRQAIATANARIFQAAAAGTGKGMGTTVVCAVLRGRELFVAHVGDSRAYLLRNGHLQQLTEDHTVVAELLRQGQLTPEQVIESSRRNVLSRALGPSPTVVPDVQGPIEMEVADLILLCTDGVSGYESAEQIGVVLNGDLDSPQRAADALIAQANEAGGHDNATAVVIRVEEPVTERLVEPIAQPAPTPSQPSRPPPDTRSRPGKSLVVGVLAILGLCLSCAAGSWLSGTVAAPFWLEYRARDLGGEEAAILHWAAVVLRGTPAPTELPTQPSAVFVKVIVITATPAHTPVPSPAPTATDTFTPTATPSSTRMATLSAILVATLTPVPTPEFTATHTPTLTAIPKESSASSQSQDSPALQADLSIHNLEIVRRQGMIYAVTVDISNQGPGPASLFHISCSVPCRANGETQLTFVDFTAAATLESGDKRGYGLLLPDCVADLPEVELSCEVDSRHFIIENDETNNVLSQTVSLPR